ncbi:MAG: mechanosensitive ion channel family protein [Bacteroidetes bacterium]|nr:MAG: mechanosensitive ion channel family protein [Bacteroidota bacterium]
MTELFKRFEIFLAPHWIAIISIVIFIGLSFLIQFLFDKVLRQFAKRTETKFDDHIIDALHLPVLFTLILAGIIIVLADLHLKNEFFVITNKIIYSVISLIWCFALIRITTIIVKNSISKISSETGLSKDVIPFLSNFLKFAIFVGAVTVIFIIWKVDVTPLIASAGVVSVIIALAAKDTLANFFGGVSVFIDKPYRIGDYIELDQKERGEVVEIGIRSTRIKTRDDILISIPNSIIANSKIINESAPVKHFRVRVPIGVAYGSDIDLVENVLIEIAKNNENIIPDPEPRARFRQFGESSLDFELLCWAKEPALRGLTIHQICKEIYKKFNELGIVIPYPQRDLHIKGNLEQK